MRSRYHRFSCLIDILEFLYQLPADFSCSESPKFPHSQSSIPFEFRQCSVNLHLHPEEEQTQKTCLWR